MLRMIFLSVSIFTMVPVAYAGKVELTTYYPAPYGEYSSLQSNTVKLVPGEQPACNAAAEGTMHFNVSTHQVQVCDGTAWGSIGGNPPGMVAAFAMATPPSGWLICNGAAVSRTTYAGLFAAIGTLYGAGDGSSTFNLPDYRGYFLRGLGGVDPDAATRSIGTIQTDKIINHRHFQNARESAYKVNAGGSVPYVEAWAESTPGLNWPSYGTGAQDFSGNKIGGTETRPKNRAVIYCIKH